MEEFDPAEVEKKILAARKYWQDTKKEVVRAKAAWEKAIKERYPIGHFYIYRWDSGGRRWRGEKPEQPVINYYKLIWVGGGDYRNRKSLGITNKAPFETSSYYGRNNGETVEQKNLQASIGNGLYLTSSTNHSRWGMKETVYQCIEKMIGGMNRLKIPAVMSEQFIMRYNALQEKLNNVDAPKEKDGTDKGDS